MEHSAPSSTEHHENRLADSYWDSMEQHLGRSVGKSYLSLLEAPEELKRKASYYPFPVSGDYLGFVFNTKELQREINGTIQSKDTTHQKLQDAEEAQGVALKKLSQGTPIDKEIGLIRKAFKIHLQPRKDSIKEVFDKLIQLYANDPELRELAQVFKVSLSEKVKQDVHGGTLPEIVMYVYSYIQMQKAIEKITKYFEGYEKFASTESPRFNYQINELIYVAQSGADFKNVLKSRGVLDKYFDKNSNYGLGKNTLPPFTQPDIFKSRNFDELYRAIDAIQQLTGSDGKRYDAVELKNRIDAVRNNGSLQIIPRSGGLRNKVRELMSKI